MLLLRLCWGRQLLPETAFAYQAVAFDPPGGVRTDLEVLCELARGLGKGQFFTFTQPRQVFDELRRASAQGSADYSGITYEKIEAKSGVFWPCPAEEHPGTPRLFLHSFPTPTGRARFQLRRWMPTILSTSRPGAYSPSTSLAPKRSEWHNFVNGTRAACGSPSGHGQALWACRWREGAALDPARYGPVQSQSDLSHPRGYHLCPLPLERTPIGQPFN